MRYWTTNSQTNLNSKYQINVNNVNKNKTLNVFKKQFEFAVKFYFIS